MNRVLKSASVVAAWADTGDSAAQNVALIQSGTEHQVFVLIGLEAQHLMTMSVTRKSLLDSATDWFAILGDGLRLVFTWPTAEESDVDGPLQVTDPDFEGWLHNDPMVTGNPASRYGDDAPGYLTGNGLGSLEIGAADD